MNINIIYDRIGTSKNLIVATFMYLIQDNFELKSLTFQHKEKHS